MFALSLCLHNTHTAFARGYFIGLLDTGYQSTASFETSTEWSLSDTVPHEHLCIAQPWIPKFPIQWRAIPLQAYFLAPSVDKRLSGGYALSLAEHRCSFRIHTSPPSLNPMLVQSTPFHLLSKSASHRVRWTKQHASDSYRLPSWLRFPVFWMLLDFTQFREKTANPGSECLLTNFLNSLTTLTSTLHNQRC
jgi:hypothetical protein